MSDIKLTKADGGYVYEPLGLVISPGVKYGQRKIATRDGWVITAPDGGTEQRRTLDDVRRNIHDRLNVAKERAATVCDERETNPLDRLRCLLDTLSLAFAGSPHGPVVEEAIRIVDYQLSESTPEGGIVRLLDVLQATGIKQAVLTPGDGPNLPSCELRDRPERLGEEEHTNVVVPAETLEQAILGAVDHYIAADAHEAGEFHLGPALPRRRPEQKEAHHAG
jgi:hypothetical protein